MMVEMTMKKKYGNNDEMMLPDQYLIVRHLSDHDALVSWRSIGQQHLQHARVQRTIYLYKTFNSKTSKAWKEKKKTC